MKRDLELAIRGAKTAGEMLLQPNADLDIHHKGTIDLVTQYDRLAEEAIVSILSETGYNILAEESGFQRGAKQHRVWIIDPLDGTTNFSHSIPHFCVSIALKEKDEIVLAVIYDPNRKELFHAEKGQGAFLNGERISVSSCEEVSKAVILTGFGYDRHERSSFYLHYFSYFLQHSRGLRRAGSAALDLAWLACGRGDAFWEFNLKPWDIAAGILLVKEAGGDVLSLVSSQHLLEGNILASSPFLSTQLEAIFQKLHGELE